MMNDPTELRAIHWDGGAIVLLDQTALPSSVRYVRIKDTSELVDAIRRKVVRGAPALGVAGALGVALAMDEGVTKRWSTKNRDAAIAALRAARPTVINLAREVERASSRIPEGRDAVVRHALGLIRNEERANRELSILGADWLLDRLQRPKLRALTHGNAGSLASVGWGSALGVLHELHERQRLEFVYVNETRPLLQGARLTTLELTQMKIAHALEVDSSTASTICTGRVDFAIVGAGRITSNGDVINTIGTLGIALACSAADIPFIVASPQSTVDTSTASGDDFSIEERDGDEITHAFARARVPPGCVAYNPAIDVTPACLVTAIVTERGISQPPSNSQLPYSSETPIDDGPGPTEVGALGTASDNWAPALGTPESTRDLVCTAVHSGDATAGQTQESPQPC